MATHKIDIKDIPLSEIHADHTWNARGTHWATQANEEDGGFAGLVESIKANGLEVPVCVRPNPDPKAKSKYLLVYGFRRFEAVTKIAIDAGEKNPTIRAEIRTMNDAEARGANIAENTARDNLRVPDLALAISQLGAMGVNDVGIAASIGKSNTYVSDLHRIAKGLPPKILNDWRNAVVPLKVTDMRSVVSEKEPADMAKKYAELVAKQSAKAEPKTDEDKAKAKVEGLKKKAFDFGFTLGKLDTMGFLPSEKIKFAECIDVILPATADIGAAKRKTVANAAEKGWGEGCKAAEGDDSESDSDDDSDENDDK